MITEVRRSLIISKSGTADSQWINQEACFARANQVWLAINYTSVTSGE